MSENAVHEPEHASAGLYLHIPFCRTKCAYCDFSSYPGLEPLHAGYLEAVALELAQRAPRWRGVSFDTLYVGGGTPTVLPTEALVRIPAMLGTHLALTSPIEASIEANPGTVSHAALAELRRAGFNRLSLGVQSLRADELHLLGRAHSVEDARQAARWAHSAGFCSVNLDLIYGLPRQPLISWHDTLLRALELEPEHLSLYALSLEEGTPLAHDVASGRLPAPDEGLAADMYKLAEDLLARAGYTHYEISNWALRRSDEAPGAIPALACRHNLTYWRNGRYLGLGVAAWSYDGARRLGNVTAPQEYIQRVARGLDPVDQAEETDTDRELGETMMMGLRLLTGVSHGAFRRRFGRELSAVYGEEIRDLEERGLLISDCAGIRLTPRGRLLGNQVFGAFLR